jgi:adenosine deaminase
MIDKKLPLVDLHRHLEGSVRLQTILDLARLHNIPLPANDIEGIRPEVQVTEPQPGVMEFISKFHWVTEIMADYEACRRLAREVVEDAARENIDYLEMRFSPLFMAEKHALDPTGVVDAVVAGAMEGSEATHTKINLIGIISRTYGCLQGWRELDALLSRKDHIRALDLAGDEMNFPGEDFAEHFKKARDAGWNITVHAGEAAGPQTIWTAIHHLKAERIGHGLKAVDDPELMDYLRDENIGIECNLTSNVQTSCVDGYSSHPLRQFLVHGIAATINTDDPGISGIDLTSEYEEAAPAAGLDEAEIRQAQVNALEISFLSDDEKQALRIMKANRSI